MKKSISQKNILVVGGRNIGRKHAWVLSLKEILKKGEEVYVVGVLNQDDLLSRLKDVGVDVVMRKLESYSPVSGTYDGFKETKIFELSEKS